MISTIEEKAATLRKRWFELHPTPVEKPQPKQQPKLAGLRMGPGDTTTFSPEMFKSLKLLPATVNGEKPTLIQQLEDSIVRENLRKFIRGEYKRGTTNNSPYLQHLRNVEWVANIAVGIDKRFEPNEWWSVCAPVGVMISYIGATAKERAIAKAHELKEYY